MLMSKGTSSGAMGVLLLGELVSILSDVGVGGSDCSDVCLLRLLADSRATM